MDRSSTYPRDPIGGGGDAGVILNRCGGVVPPQHQPAADPGREEAQITRLRQLSEDAELDPAFAEKFLNFIVSEVIQHHRAIAADRA